MGHSKPSGSWAEQCPRCGVWHYSLIELARHLLRRHHIGIETFGPAPRRRMTFLAAEPGLIGPAGPARPEIVCWCGWHSDPADSDIAGEVSWCEHLLASGGLHVHFIAHALGCGEGGGE